MKPGEIMQQLLLFCTQLKWKGGDDKILQWQANNYVHWLTCTLPRNHGLNSGSCAKNLENEVN